MILCTNRYNGQSVLRLIDFGGSYLKQEQCFQDKVRLHEEIDTINRFDLDEQVRIYLKNWMYENWVVPYPSDEELQTMSEETGWDEKDIKDWLASFRSEVWKLSCYIAYNSSNTMEEFLQTSLKWGKILDEDSQEKRKRFVSFDDGSELSSQPQSKRVRQIDPVSSNFLHKIP